MIARRRLKLPSGRAVVGGILVVSALLGAAAVFARNLRPEPEPEITLWAGEDQPLPSVWVALRCGDEHHRVVSNARGGISLPASCREAPTVDGFELLRTERVGKEERFHFSARGMLRFELLDRLGRRLPDVPTTITLHSGPDGVAVKDTRNGIAEFPAMPLALPARLIQIFPSSREWSFTHLRAKRQTDGILYSVRLERHRSVPVEIPPDGILT